MPFAVANFTDDVRVFAGCLTGRRDWPTAACEGIAVPRLAGAIAHAELAVTHTTPDEQRPQFHCRVLRTVAHAPFMGFNRAQAAVVEAAILVSRLHMLPREKVEREIAYLQIAVEQDRRAGRRRGVEMADGGNPGVLRRRGPVDADQ